MIRIDFNQAALLAIAVITAVALLSQWRWVRRTHQLLQRDLERIFEQVDLVRFDAQQQPVAEAAGPVATEKRVAAQDTGLGYAAALELAASGASEAEITKRCGLSAPEARILVAMRALQGKSRSLH